VLLAVVAPAASAAPIPVYAYDVAHTYPHDDHAFTEGLFYLKGNLFESTGEFGNSTIRRVNLQDGAVLQTVKLPNELFGEGIVNWKDQLISVTWKNGIGFRRDLKDFSVKSEFHYSGEGWALTQNGKEIILSDGSPRLHFLDPETLREKHHIDVSAHGTPIENLNELEWVDGEIFANVWQTNYIARIDPVTGQVKAWIDLSGLPETVGAHDPDNVLNGIAYDSAGHRLFVTGKRWPHLYEIKLKRKGAG
jgi:glutaminyl-peptide cyclotransferase